jgi:transposase
MQSNPAASPDEIAIRFSLSKQAVYGLRSKMKKEGFVFPKKSEQMPSLAPAEPMPDTPQVQPKRYAMSMTQVQIAEKMGIPVPDYAQKLKEMGMLQELLAESSEEDDIADTVDETLDARAVDYGKFIEGAEVMQMLKRVVLNALNNRDKVLAHDQAESLDMIIHKIGRIINGNPDVVDHWLDIAGYAQLVADRLNGRIR